MRRAAVRHLRFRLRGDSVRILFIAPQAFFASRGSPIAVLHVLESLSAGGHFIDLLTLFQGEDVSIPNVVIHRIRRPPLVKDVPIGPSWQKVLCDVAVLRQARRMLLEGRYDLIHGVEDGAVIAWALSRRVGIPFVYDMDSQMSAQLVERSAFLWPLSRLIASVEAKALREAVGVLAVCPALAEIAERYQPSRNVRLLPDMPLFEGDDTQPSPEIEGLEGTRIVYVGNLEPYQGVGLLLQAFERIVDHHPDAKLVIVGGSERQIAKYRRTTRALVDAGRVHFLGGRPLSDLGSILTSAQILASPRLRGVNTPMKIFSYLESGRPILATRLLTHTQVLNDDVSCLVEPDAGDMARGLDTLLRDVGARDALGRRARAFVRAEFSRAKFDDRLRSFYAEVEGRLSEGHGTSPSPAGGRIL